MTFMRTLAALALAAGPLLAQTPFEVRATGLIAQGDMNKITASNNLAGYSLEASARLEIKPGLDHRFYLGGRSFRSLAGTGLAGNRAPKHIYFGYDVVYAAAEKWTLFGGFFGQKWKVDSADATRPDFTDQNNRNNVGKGTKLGVRIGTEYAYNKHWHAVLGFSQTEYNKIYQPGWVDLGLGYRF